jgi:hypothetical protein
MAVFTNAPEQWTEDMWREAIKAVVRISAQPYEYVDDVVTAGWILGQKRAELRSREKFLPGVHPQYALDILSWWPFKPTYSAQVLAEIILPKRWEVVRGIRTNAEQSDRLRNLIPDDILTMSVDGLYERIAKDGGRELALSLKW